ncbi:hypothetical protein EPUL_006563 [Erysiphe pulchra]|uniref:Uncharacterized protein n=1 Tax=Erysiphe pulchra TaxID=225359 RepID=A0A2S4PPA0_9PEZI|nr:hypothetical protein EPUL_006563 [Erysiphe pulchra]
MISLVDLFISWILLSYIVSTHIVLDQRELKENGYDCGDAFFNDQMVHDRIKTALSEKEKKNLLPYSGPLYSSEESYMMSPILPMGTLLRSTKSRQKAIYKIVFDKNGKVIDMIVRLANRQFAKCWRIDKQRSETSIYDVVESNGYDCGYKFIRDSKIAECASIARETLDKGNNYLPQYRGNLYSQEIGYKLWPIYHRDSIIHQYPKNQRIPTFFIVIDSTGQLKDVIARTSKNNHIRCMRVKKILPAPDIDELSRTFAKPPRNGYKCKEIFFESNYIQRFSYMIQDQATKWLPRRYDCAPFHSPCFLLPLNENGKSYRENHVEHLLVLATDFSVMHVAMQVGKDLVPCEKEEFPRGYEDRNFLRYDSDVNSHEEPGPTTEIARKKRKYSP